MQISFKEAEALKRKVVLSLSATDSDFYEVNLDGVITPISAKLTNEIVASRLDMIVALINKCLTKMRANLTQTSNYLPIYLTGGGVCLLKGGRDYLSKGVGENVEVLTSKIPQLSKPIYSSVLGLLDLAIKEKRNQKTSLWQKIKGWFKR